jgi:hypothetical protein
MLSFFTKTGRETESGNCKKRLIRTVYITQMPKGQRYSYTIRTCQHYSQTTNVTRDLHLEISVVEYGGFPKKQVETFLFRPPTRLTPAWAIYSQRDLEVTSKSYEDFQIAFNFHEFCNEELHCENWFKKKTLWSLIVIIL